MAAPQEATYRDICEFMRTRLQTKRLWLKQHGREQPLIDIDEQSCRVIAAASRGNFKWAADALHDIAAADGAMSGPESRQPRNVYEDLIVAALKESWPTASTHW